jgi:sec-independent protein translocase protein TatC
LQLWKFIAPALRRKERKYTLLIVVYSTFCILLGVAFAYFIMLPTAFNLISKIGTQLIKNEFAIDEYISLLSHWLWLPDLYLNFHDFS